MTDEQMSKCQFVTGPLKTLLAEATGGYMEHLSYSAHNDDEKVRATFVDGSSVAVNVSCDSKWALVKDVIAGVALRYE